MKRITLPYGGLFNKISLLFALLVAMALHADAQLTFNNVSDLTNPTSHCYTLTAAAESQRGSVWGNTKIDLQQNFDISFTLNFGNRSSYSGGDGMAFVLQPTSVTQIGIGGSAKGYGNTYLPNGSINIPGISPSVDIEYDTYDDYGGTTASAALLLNGDYRRTQANMGVDQVPIGYVNDGQYHTSRVTWNASTKTITLYFDGVQKFSYVRDFVTDIFSNQNLVYFGFTAGTGGAYNQQSVCINTDLTTFTSNINPPLPTPTISASGSLNLCSSGSVVLTSSYFTGNTWSNGAITQAITVTLATVGSYTVSVAHGTIISTSAATIVTANPVPTTPTISASGSLILCSNNSVVLTSSAATGNTWSNGATTQSITVTASGSYTVTVTNGGCTATSTPTIVTVNASPPPVIGGSSSVCSGSTIILNGTPSGGIWSVSVNGTPIVDQSNTSYNDQSGGTFQWQSFTAGVSGQLSSIEVSHGNPRGTNASSVITVKVYSGVGVGGALLGTQSFNYPAQWGSGFVNYAFNGVNLVQGQQYTFEITTPQVQYSWLNVDVNGGYPGGNFGPYIPQWDAVFRTYMKQMNASVNSSGEVTGLQSGSATVNYTVTNNGCNGLAAFPVTVNTVPAALITVSGATIFCSGGSVTLTSSSVTGNVWSNGATTQSIAVTQSGSYTVIATNASGCSSPISAAVLVTVGTNTAPVADIASLPVITGECSATATAPTAKDGCGNTIIGIAGGPVSFNTQGNNTITWTYTDAGGNQSTQTQQVIIKDITAPTVIVKNITVNLDATGHASVTPAQVDNGSSDNCGPVTLSFLNKGTICATVDERYGNQNVLTLTAPPGAIFTSIDFASYGTPVGSCGNFTMGSCNATNSKSIVESVALGKNSFTILPDNATFGDPCGNVYKRLYVQATYTFGTTSSLAQYDCRNIGLNTVTLNVTDANGNSATATANIIVNGTVPTATVTASGPTTFCSGGSVTLTSSSVTGNVWSNGATTQSIAVTQSGSYAVTATNASGCSSPISAAVLVTVGTNTAPVADIASLPVITSECSATATAPTAKDGCGNALMGIAGGPVSFNTQGNYLINWTYIDASGKQSTQTQQVIVKDVTAPGINTVVDRNVTATSAAGALVTYTAPVATDNCGVPTTVRTAGLASGSLFPLGTTIVTYRATDAVSLTASTSFNVTVSGIVPLLTIPADISVNNDPGKCGANVNFTATETTGIPASTIAYSVPSGSLFPIGTTTVTVTATNVAGISTKTFKVTVTDNEKPIFVIATPGTATVTIPAMQTIVSSCAPAIYNFIDPLPAGAVVTGIDLTYSAHDQNWGGSNQPDDLFVSGTHVASSIYTGATQTFNTTFTGSIPGYVYGGNNTFGFVFTCYPGWQGFINGGTMTIRYQRVLSAITVNNDPGKCGAAVTLTAPSVTDNCSVASVQSNAPALFPIGTTNVTWTATDVNGKISTTVQRVTVTDNESPKITAPADVNVNTDNGSNIATNVNLGTPITSDNCGAIASLINDAPTAFPIGATTVTWTVTDTHGNSTSATQIVTVADKAPPVFRSMSLDITKNNDLNVCGAIVTYIPPVASDNGSTTIVTITEGGGDNIITFNTQLSYNVSSLDFISSSQFQDIVHGHGVDISVGIELFNPQSNTWISVQTIQTGTGDYHFGGTSAKFNAILQVSKIRFVISQPVYAAFHVYDLAVNLNSINVVQTSGLPSGSLFPIGKTINAFRAIDPSGNIATSGFTVTIYDAEKPVVTNYASSTQNAGGTCYWTGSPSTIAINDNCPIALLVTEKYLDQRGKIIYTGSSMVSQGNYVMTAKSFPTGVNTVYVSVTDGAGNSNQEAKFTVTVLDVTAPTISVVPVIYKNNSPGFCSASVVVPAPVIADNCTIASLVNSYNKTSNATDRYPVGSTVIIWTVTDASGNKTTATQTIVVTDNEAPAIAIPVDIIQTVDAGSCGAMVTWPEARVTDNCGILSSSSNRRSGETFLIGTTTVTYTATDIHNNTSTARFTITVTDNQAPRVITQPVTVILVNGAASILASDINNGSSDNCGAVTLAASKTSFTCADAGINLVTLTVTDRFGNMASDIALVTVVGETPTSSIAVAPNSTVFTGGVPTNLYLGYGPTAVTLTENVTGITPITYSWSGAGLNCITCQSPVFTPTVPGNYTFTVMATNKYGCTTTPTVSICVRDIKVTATANSKVYVCHTDLLTGATSTLQLAVNAVVNQLVQNPQDLLGICGMPACAATSVNTETPAVTVINSKETGLISSEEEFTVKVSPNPSNTVFTFVVTTARKIPVHVRLIDGAGRTMESMNNAPVATAFKMGGRLFDGVYYAEFIQGNERVVVKLIKQIR